MNKMYVQRERKREKPTWVTTHKNYTTSGYDTDFIRIQCDLIHRINRTCKKNINLASFEPFSRKKILIKGLNLIFMGKIQEN